MPRRVTCKSCGTPFLEGSACPHHGTVDEVDAQRKRQQGRYRARRATAKVYSSPAWRRLRKTVIARDGCCCVCSHEGSPENPLTVHHMHPLAAGGEAFPDASELVTYCRRHHP